MLFSSILVLFCPVFIQSATREGWQGKGRAIRRSAIKGMVPPTLHALETGDVTLVLKNHGKL